MHIVVGLTVDLCIFYLVKKKIEKRSKKRKEIIKITLKYKRHDNYFAQL